MTLDGRSTRQRLRSRLEIAAYRELRPLVREGRIRLRTAVIGVAMLGVLANAGLIAYDLSNGAEVAPRAREIGAQEVGAVGFDDREADAPDVDTRRYDILKDFSEPIRGNGLAAMEDGYQRAQWVDAHSNKLPDCGRYEAFEDPRAADLGRG